VRRSRTWPWVVLGAGVLLGLCLLCGVIATVGWLAWRAAYAKTYEGIIEEYMSHTAKDPSSIQVFDVTVSHGEAHGTVVVYASARQRNRFGGLSVSRGRFVIRDAQVVEHRWADPGEETEQDESRPRVAPAPNFGPPPERRP
jgi:hypothetical protein